MCFPNVWPNLQQCMCIIDIFRRCQPNPSLLLLTKQLLNISVQSMKALVLPCCRTAGLHCHFPSLVTPFFALYDLTGLCATKWPAACWPSGRSINIHTYIYTNTHTYSYTFMWQSETRNVFQYFTKHKNVVRFYTLYLLVVIAVFVVVVFLLLLCTPSEPVPLLSFGTGSVFLIL